MLVLPKIEEEGDLNKYPAFYWNHVGLEMNRITHSLGGPHGGPTMSSRALGLLQLAMHDAFFAALGNDASNPATYLLVNQTVDGKVVDGPLTIAKKSAAERFGNDGVAAGDLDNANRALTGAAITVLDDLYTGDHRNISIVASDTLTGNLKRLIGAFEFKDACGKTIGVEILHPAHQLGVAIAQQIMALLAVKPGEPGADEGRYEPKQGPYYFRDEPVTPVRPQPIDPNDPSRGSRALRVYHGPVYGFTVKTFAAHTAGAHQIAEWPDPRKSPALADVYKRAFDEVVALGGAPGLASTKRKPSETVIAYFWAYDGANLIGTPPRLYNQIIRNVAFKKTTAANELEKTKEFVRVLALTNVAMADAGKFAWREKYRFELWRPLSGVREEPDRNRADPFWQALGAPETNTDKVSFKPPFPAYPSGHATFGAAAFQMLRLFYGARDQSFSAIETKVKADGYQDVDNLSFTFVSDELNGISRDLRQPYDPSTPIEDQQGDVRTKIECAYESLWKAIFDNGFSRIYLGVHWNFDAAAASDTHKTAIPDDRGLGQVPKAPADIKYSNVWRPGRAANALPTGGVPLGLGIANDIFLNGMKQDAAATTTSVPPSSEPFSKRSNTTYRS
jgi:vanadium chloroperoxidase